MAVVMLCPREKSWSLGASRIGFREVGSAKNVANFICGFGEDTKI